MTNARIFFRHLPALALLLCATPRLPAQPPQPRCDWSAFDHNAADLRAARDAALKITETDLNTDVPPEAIKQIQQFKNSLSDALNNYFLCQPSQFPDAQALESDLYTRLAVAIPPPPDKRPEPPQNDSGPQAGLYLSDITLKVKIVPDQRKLIAVLTTFGIPYGEDAELDIFAPANSGKWQPVISFTSKPYNSIAGAFLGFDYKISPPDSKGDWFMVATHINPWPQSCWQNLYIDAVRPNQLGMLYQLFHEEQNGYICDDAAPYLRGVKADSFQLRFSIASIDESQLSSPSLMTYKVEGDEVTRIEPVALNPVNFVDEWTRRTWRDAQGWSVPTNLAQLSEDHAKLHNQASGDFVGFRACTAPLTSEVEFKADDGEGPSRFFLVKKNPDGYIMLKISDRPTPSCRTPNRITAIKDR